MLSRELLDMYRAQTLDMFVDSAGDDVYSWGVEVASFAPGSGLAADMAELSRRHGYSSVRFTLHFMRGLHPFFPAHVELVRPQFKWVCLWRLGGREGREGWKGQRWVGGCGEATARCVVVCCSVCDAAGCTYVPPLTSLAFIPTSCIPTSCVRPRDWAIGAVASHPMLTQAHWDPWRPQAKLVAQVKAFLEVGCWGGAVEGGEGSHQLGTRCAAHRVQFTVSRLCNQMWGTAAPAPVGHCMGTTPGRNTSGKHVCVSAATAP